MTCLNTTAATTSCRCLVPVLLTYRPTGRRPERLTTRPTDGPLDQPPDRLAHQSNGHPAAAMYGTGRENWRSARVGIRGAFAAFFGGHSGGIRGHSRAFARLMPLFGCHRFHAKIMCSPMFCSKLRLRSSHRVRHRKTQNACRADPFI